MTERKRQLDILATQHLRGKISTEEFIQRTDEVSATLDFRQTAAALERHNRISVMDSLRNTLQGLRR